MTSSLRHRANRLRPSFIQSSFTVKAPKDTLPPQTFSFSITSDQRTYYQRPNTIIGLSVTGSTRSAQPQRPSRCAFALPFKATGQLVLTTSRPRACCQRRERTIAIAIAAAEFIPHRRHIETTPIEPPLHRARNHHHHTTADPSSPHPTDHRTHHTPHTPAPPPIHCAGE